MGYRNYDWECTNCRTKAEALVWVAGGGVPTRNKVLWCARCKTHILHDRLMSCPAPYTGEVVHNPQMHGGSYDTMGCEPMPELPPTPGFREYAAKVSQVESSMPQDMAPIERHRQAREAVGAAPVAADIAAHHAKSEVKEIKAERKRIAKRNRLKRQRAKAIASGGAVNMRRDKCPGDPKI